MVPPALREDHNFKFKPMKTIYDSFHNTNIFNKNYKELIAMKFFTSPRFTGLFGTELFGYIPEWFIESISLNFDVFSAKIFTPVFLSRLHAGKNRGLFCNYGNTPGLSNQIYSFLYQIGRTYLNAHYTRSWERPTKFFSYLSLNPFADSKFVALLCSFDYDRHMQYRLYQEIYKNYYPGFLDIAWTRASHRIQKNLKNDSQQEIDSGLAKQQELLKLITEDVDFRAFVKQNSIVQKTGVAISARLKELYFLFKWYDVYKSVLCPSDVKFLSD
jgi:hypothetical protein